MNFDSKKSEFDIVQVKNMDLSSVIVIVVNYVLDGYDWFLILLFVRVNGGYKYKLYVKRFMNVFMVWVQVVWRKLVDQYLYFYNVELSKILGKLWKLLNDVEKKFFIEEVERLWLKYKREYFDYKY